MGVSGLNTFIKKHGGLILRDYSLRSTRLIIDGQNVCHELFYAFQQQNDHFYGGDYDHFAQVCRDFFTALRHCDVTPYVIYDGAYDALKFPTKLSRASDRIEKADKISRGKDGVILPVMSYETFRDVVDSMGIHHVTCNFEADHQAAALAILWKCPILSRDTDFLIYNVPAGVVLWDFMDVKKFVSEAISGKNRNPTVKIYNVSAVLHEVRSSDPRILALWATLLGNDRVDSKQFDAFFNKAKLPSKCGRIRSDRNRNRNLETSTAPTKAKSREPAYSQALNQNKIDGVQDPGRHQRVVLGVLGWLGSRSTVENALETLLSLYSAEKGPNIESVIRTSMAAYTDLTCEVEGHFSDPTQLTGGGSLESFARRQIPDWFMVGIRSGRIPVHALDALVHRQVILPTHVSVTSQPSPYQCSATLRRFLYSVLLIWDDEPDTPQLKGSFIKEFDRDQNLKLKNEEVHALEKLDIGRRVPSLEEIPLMTEPERKSLLLDVLGVTSLQLDGFEPRTHLLIATIVHWIRNSIPTVNNFHLESLLVCFHRAGILGNRIQGGKDDSLEELRKTPDKISPPRTFDCAVVHSFAQFQCCLQMALYINQILLLPAPHPLPVLAFNGTFLHNFYRKLVEPRCQQQGQQEQQMQHDEEQEGWQRPRCQMRQQRNEQPAQQQQTTPRQQQIQQQQWQQQQSCEIMPNRYAILAVWRDEPRHHEQNRARIAPCFDQQQQQLQYAGQQESSCGQYLVCSSTAGVNSEIPNSLEAACAEIAIYRDKLLSII